MTAAAKSSGCQASIASSAAATATGIVSRRTLYCPRPCAVSGPCPLRRGSRAASAGDTTMWVGRCAGRFCMVVHVRYP
ncbi:MAG: hypothetical protein FWE75_08805 [Actinomycetia bacterium]|nr:hypothetical protein [Actinomycetes bacterium]